MEVIILILRCILLAFSQNAPAILPVSPPFVTVKNGTLRGFHVKGFNQIGFFGIPFAAPPLDDLRLRHPQPFNEAFSGVRGATKRSLSCPGFGAFANGFDMGEDGLTLDVVLPVNIEPSDALPVLVWIYGGGAVFIFTSSS
jgi:carboxylesterase type B